MRPVPDIISISYQYSPNEHADALSHGAGQQKARRHMRLLGLALPAVGILLAGLEAMSLEAFAAVALLNLFLWSALGAFWFWLGPSVQKVSTRWELRRGSKGESVEMERVTFDDHGFAPSAEWSRPMPWSFVERVEETERLILIYHLYATDPFYVPKQSLSPQTAEKLFALLNEQFRTRPQQLKLLPRGT
jgi:hypothetical protein